MIAKRLCGEPAPRPETTSKLVVAKHAPWWGFAIYSLFWAFLGCTVFAALVAMCVEPFGWSPSLTWAGWTVPSLVSLAVIAPFFARWVVRRRRAIRELARAGVVFTAPVVNMHVSPLALVSGSSKVLRQSRVIVVGIEDGHEQLYYRATVSAKSAGLFSINAPVTVVCLRGCRYALVIAADGEDFLAKH